MVARAGGVPARAALPTGPGLRGKPGCGGSERSRYAGRTISTDRMCYAWALDNRLRRWLAPARHELRFLDLGPGQAVADLGAGPGYFGPETFTRSVPKAGW